MAKDNILNQRNVTIKFEERGTGHVNPKAVDVQHRFVVAEVADAPQRAHALRPHVGERHRGPRWRFGGMRGTNYTLNALNGGLQRGNTMSKLLLTLALLVASIVYASAQSTVAPRWNRSGSAVCPNDYDYAAGLNRCVARGYAEYRGGYRGGGVTARWNSRGSAVCPEGYEYVQRRGGCFPQ